MKRKRRAVVAEWMFVIMGPARGQSGLHSIEVENVDASDMPMARALAMVVAVWLNAARRLA